VLYADVSLQAFLGAGVASYLSVFLVRLGASNWLVSLFTSLPALVTILAALPVGAYVQRSRNLIRTVCVGRLIFRSVVGLFALLPFLTPSVAPVVLVIARSLIAIPSVAGGVAHTTVLGKAISPRRRPQVLSNRMAFHRLTGTIVGYLAGQWLTAVAYPVNYQLLFATALLCGIGGFVIYSRLRLPQEDQPEIKNTPKAGLREMIRLIVGTPDFGRFAVAALVFRFGMHLPSSLYTIYKVRELGCSDAWIGVLLTVERILSLVGFVVLSRVLRKPRVRKWLWVSCAGTALLPFTTALARTPEMLLIPSTIVGLFGAGMNVFLTNTLFTSSSEETRPAFAATNTFLANTTAFLAPLFGTALADTTSITKALLFAGVVRLGGAMMFYWLRVGQKRERPAEAGA